MRPNNGNGAGGGARSKRTQFLRLLFASLPPSAYWATLEESAAANLQGSVGASAKECGNIRAASCIERIVPRFVWFDSRLPELFMARSVTEQR